jgi:hypothetical protein
VIPHLPRQASPGSRPPRQPISVVVEAESGAMTIRGMRLGRTTPTPPANESDSHADDAEKVKKRRY